MIFPATTAFYAGLLALIFVGLSGWVVAGRVSGDVLHGDGGNNELAKRIRAHGNFAEYVPFAVLLVAIYEAGGGTAWIVQTLMVVLVIARLLHPFGMLAPKNSPQQFACRGGGILTTLIVVVVAGILLLLRSA